MNPNNNELKNILLNYKKVSIVGLSHKESRPSYVVAKYLQNHDYDICAVKPSGPDTILGKNRYSDISLVPNFLEIVNVFRAPQFIPEIVNQVLLIGAKVLWLQEGIFHKESEQKARDGGLIVVSDLCIKKIHQKLFF